MHGGHDHARRAVAALQSMFFMKALLHRMQLAIARQPLDSRNLRPVCLRREDRARFHSPAVEKNRASAALAGVAANMRAGKPKMLAQEVHEQHARLDLCFMLRAIDGECYRDGLELSLSSHVGVLHSRMIHSTPLFL